MLPAIPGSATACLTRWIGFGFGQRLVLAQPAENIFHVDNRIIHHFTQRDDQSAERNGVNRNAKLLQDDDRGEQGQRNGRQRNTGGPNTSEQKEQDHRDQDRAQRQGMFHVAQGRLDKRGGPVQTRIELDAFAGEDRFHFRQGSLQRGGHFHGVSAKLAGHGKQHP